MQKVFTEGRFDRLENTLKEHQQMQLSIDTLKV